MSHTAGYLLDEPQILGHDGHPLYGGCLVGEMVDRPLSLGVKAVGIYVDAARSHPNLTLEIVSDAAVSEAVLLEPVW